MGHPAPTEAPAILLVAPDDALRYLMERYARRGGYTLRAMTDDGRSPSVVWVSSLEALETVRPRERGIVGDEVPVIVIASEGEDSRARELGADHRVTQPITYRDFLAALSAVGLAP
jgi:CheY-like chemotaxis protein